MRKEGIRIALVLTAAGTSSRFKTGKKKEFIPLASNIFPNQKGGTVLSCSAEAFLKYFLETSTVKLSNFFITVSNKNQIVQAKKALLDSPFVVHSLQKLHIEPTFILGSDTRQKSVYCALDALNSSLSHIDLVLIHDAARPYISVRIVEDVVEAVITQGAAVPIIPPVDTQKEVNQEGKIVRHLLRSTLGAVQTPQGFRFAELVEAHKKAANDKKEYTDDTEIWGQYVGDVFTVEGSEKNTKITFKKDIETHMERLPSYRTGLGQDLHKLVDGRKLMIGGIEIPFTKGELAHSDGDVLLHAITDSLLGAAGLGDIGELFPPSDNKWKNANSCMLLQSAWEKVKHEGWVIENIDCVIQIENPKFLPWREKVIESIASILDCKKEIVFVKAKTNEGLGDIGLGNAISATVICLLKK